MNAPVEYIERFMRNPAEDYSALLLGLDWERRGDTPRHEYYSNDFPNPYAYGTGHGRRLYMPRPWHPIMVSIRAAIEARTGTRFEVCFLNRYDDGHDHLGWHADDSPEMDDTRPIAIVSLGAAREIWFRPKPPAFVEVAHERREERERRWMERASIVRRIDAEATEKLVLGDGSLCVMPAGMQRAWQHRIPKSSRACGGRVSLTFRGYRGPAVSTTAHAA